MIMVDMVAVGSRLRGLRLERGLTQEVLCQELHISQETISRIETGERQITLDTLILMADFFNIPVDYILGRSALRANADRLAQQIERLDQLYIIIEPFEELNPTNKKIVREMIKGILKVQMEESIQ